MIDHKTVEKYLLSLPNAKLDYPFGEGVAVYKFIPTPDADVNGANPDADGRGKMFALVTEGKMPVSISLKCDPLLAVTLREKYETVMPGFHLNKKHWNTIVLSGQLSWQEVQDLISHSYNLVAEKPTRN